jgi:hypothetical protein
MSNGIFDEAASAEDFDAVEVDPTEVPADNDLEKNSLLEQLAMEQAAEMRESILETYPALAPFVDMLGGADEDSIRQLAHELNARIGGEVVADDHPGDPDPVKSLPGDSAMEKAKALAKQSQDYSAFFALKESAALEAEGRVGRLLTEDDRARVKLAAEFARRAGDTAAYKRLLRQLG